MLVLVGMRFEARGLARRLAPDARAGLVLWTIGPGAVGLPPSAASGEARPPPVVVVAGLAGGCAPDLVPGELVVGDPVGTLGRDAWERPDGLIRERALRALGASGVPHRVGRLVTVPRTIGVPDTKTVLYRDHAALAVDLESVPALAWARARGIPALAVRAIADGSRDAVPDGISRVVDPQGGLRPLAMLPWVARPDLLRAAWRLWRRSIPALEHLARFLAAFVRCEAAGW